MRLQDATKVSYFYNVPNYSTELFAIISHSFSEYEYINAHIVALN